MWKYNNISFIYDNPVDSKYNESYTIKELVIYVKSKYALFEAVKMHIDSSFLGVHTEIKYNTLKFDKPVKI